jgi:rsbT co-antagonist protein RsbR
MPQEERTRHSGRLAMTDHDIERRKRIVDLDERDLPNLKAIAQVILPQLDRFVGCFFDYLAALEEAKPLFASRTTLEEARRMKKEHLRSMVEGDYGRSYVEQRIDMGMLYSNAGLEVRVFLGAFHHLLHTMGEEIAKRFRSEPEAALARFMSLRKLGFLDIGIIVDVLIAERERTIELQQEALRELSTPVLQIRERLLILPIIGIIDTQRARQLTEDLLRGIRANRARVVVMDITGVAAVDSKVANHLLQTVAAARLMGATVIVTGLSADVAQALVALGVDLGGLSTVADLQGGLEEAERLLGYKVLRGSDTLLRPQSV